MLRALLRLFMLSFFCIGLCTGFVYAQAVDPCSAVLTDSRILSLGHSPQFWRALGAPALPSGGLATGSGKRFVPSTLEITPSEYQQYIEPKLEQMNPELREVWQRIYTLSMSAPYRTPLERIGMVLMAARVVDPYGNLESVMLPREWLVDEILFLIAHRSDRSTLLPELESLLAQEQIQYGQWVRLIVKFIEETTLRRTGLDWLRLLRTEIEVIDRNERNQNPAAIAEWYQNRVRIRPSQLRELENAFLRPESLGHIPVPSSLFFGVRDWMGSSDPSQMAGRATLYDRIIGSPMDLIQHDAVLHTSSRGTQFGDTRNPLAVLLAAEARLLEMQRLAVLIERFEASGDYRMSLALESLAFISDHEIPFVFKGRFLRLYTANKTIRALGEDLDLALTVLGYPREWSQWIFEDGRTLRRILELGAELP